MHGNSFLSVMHGVCRPFLISFNVLFPAVTNSFRVVKVKFNIRGCLPLATVVAVYSGDSMPLLSIGQFSRTGSLEKAVVSNTPTAVEAHCSRQLCPDPGQLVKRASAETSTVGIHSIVSP